MKTKKQFLVFISYGHGAHFNTVVDSVENVIEVLDNSCDEIEQDLLDEVSNEISALENEKNFYTEFNHGTWATITRMDIDDTGITDRETIAVINALRVYQAEDDREDIINDFGLDRDNITDDEIENLIQRINLGEVEVEYAKPVAIAQSLQERICTLSETEAVKLMVAGHESISYDDFMSLENVFEIVTICELFENDCTDTIKNHVEETSDVLKIFANAIINTMTTNDMIDIIGQRAYDGGVVDYKKDMCLVSILRFPGSRRDAAERFNGASPVNDDEVFIDIEEYDGTDEAIKNAAKFGVSYVLVV